MSQVKAKTKVPKTARELEVEERLARVTEEVAEDAKDSPAKYLKETIVPAGGE